MHLEIFQVTVSKCFYSLCMLLLVQNLCLISLKSHNKYTKSNLGFESCIKYIISTNGLNVSIKNYFCPSESIFFIICFKNHYHQHKEKRTSLPLCIINKCNFIAILGPNLVERFTFEVEVLDNYPFFSVLRGYCTSEPYFLRLCAFSQKIKQLWTKYPMDLVRNIPRNSKITVLLQ